jgi:hypothetical protein
LFSYEGTSIKSLEMNGIKCPVIYLFKTIHYLLEWDRSFHVLKSLTYQIHHMYLMNDSIQHYGEPQTVHIKLTAMPYISMKKKWDKLCLEKQKIRLGLSFNSSALFKNKVIT